MTATTAPQRRTVLRWAGQALAWVVILVASSAVVVAVLIPRIAGATPYTILTSSMEPTYPPGTLVVTRPADPDSIGAGTVITYQLRSGDPTVVTHRVVSVGYGNDGEPELITKGDANESVDVEPVKPVQVRGVLWYAIPKLGWASQAVDQDQRDVAVYVVAGGLGAYALWMFGGALWGMTRRRSPEHEDAGVSR